MDEKFKNKLLGSKFVLVEDEAIVGQVRVVSYVTPEVVRIKDLNTGKVSKIEISKLIEKYIMIKPEGCVIFSIVTIGRNKNNESVNDVIVSVYRNCDLEDVDPEPWCVCRQGIVNVFNNSIRATTTNPEDMDVAMCASKESVETLKIDYKIMLQCNELLHSVSVAYYIEDSVDDLLECIKKIDKYDNVLNLGFIDNAKRYVTKDVILKKNIFNGYCRSLKSLLDYTDFMYDFKRGNKVNYLESLDLSNITDENTVLTIEQKTKILKLLGLKQLNNETVILFNRDIILNNIVRDYILVMDKNNKLYILIFDKED